MTAPVQDQMLLAPDLLARLQNLQLKANHVVDGVLTGLHKSPQHGSSIEFAEHKEYSQGDDTRHIDWKAYGRFDRFYVKKFEDETNLRGYLLIDSSGSMGYGEGDSNKLEYARVMVAALAFLMIRQQDSPALLGFNDRVLRYMPPRSASSHFQEVLHALLELTPEGETDLATPLRFLAETVHGRNLILVISDLFDTQTDIVRMLARLKARHNEVVLFHLLHPDELDFHFEHLSLFEDMEGEERLLADPEAIRKEYLKVFLGWADKLAGDCRARGIEYRRVRTDETVEGSLLSFLLSRGG